MRRIKELTHQEKMQIYNETNSGHFFIKEICTKHDISWAIHKKVMEEVKELIDYKINGVPPKEPKVCNICGGKVEYNRCVRTKSRSGFVYYCTQCYAWVGTSPRNPRQALGELGNLETRRKRKELHDWFDKLWRNREEREYYYDKLALALGKVECHFSRMTMSEMEKALKIVKKWWLEKYDR